MAGKHSLCPPTTVLVKPKISIEYSKQRVVKLWGTPEEQIKKDTTEKLIYLPHF